jgi:hypothetical protein
MTSVTAEVCRVNNENHGISDYCGGKTASIPDRGKNNPSGMFKLIHAAAIIRTPARDRIG